MAAKYQGYKSAVASILNTKLIGSYAVTAVGETVIITIIICMTAIAILAIIKKYNVKIDYKEGKIEVVYPDSAIGKDGC